MSRERTGQLMLAIAALGVVVALVGAVVGWQLVGDLDRGVGQSLDVTADVLATLDESFVVAEDSLGILADGVREAEGAVRSLGGSLAEGQGALSSATDLTGGEVADTLEGVEAALPAIQAAARTIDLTLGALGALPFPGLDYAPDRALADTIGDLQEGLSGLPDELREQAEEVERTTEELTAATEGTLATADSLRDLDARLDEVAVLVGQYSTSIEQARAIVEEQQVGLAGSARRTQLLLVAFALVFALGQFVPFHLGRTLLREQAERDRSLLRDDAAVRSADPEVPPTER